MQVLKDKFTGKQKLTDACTYTVKDRSRYVLAIQIAQWPLTLMMWFSEWWKWKLLVKLLTRDNTHNTSVIAFLDNSVCVCVDVETGQRSSLLTNKSDKF